MTNDFKEKYSKFKDSFSFDINNMTSFFDDVEQLSAFDDVVQKLEVNFTNEKGGSGIYLTYLDKIKYGIYEFLANAYKRHELEYSVLDSEKRTLFFEFLTEAYLQNYINACLYVFNKLTCSGVLENDNEEMIDLLNKKYLKF